MQQNNETLVWIKQSMLQNPVLYLYGHYELKNGLMYKTMADKSYLMTWSHFKCFGLWTTVLSHVVRICNIYVHFILKKKWFWSTIKVTDKPRVGWVYL